MAKTVDPNKIIETFQDSVRASLARYLRVETAFDAAGESDDLHRAIAEDAAFRLGVLWEVFQGEWFVAAISREPSTFRDRIKESIGREVSKDGRRLVGVFNPSAFDVPRWPTKSQIEKSLDPNGFNITFSDSKTWNEQADKYLGPTRAARVNAVATAPESSSLIHLVKKLRNRLAHASGGSKEEFNNAVRARTGKKRVGLVGAVNEALQRGTNGVDDIGKYLRVRPLPGAPRRIETLHQRVIDVAEMLRVV